MSRLTFPIAIQIEIGNTLDPVTGVRRMFWLESSSSFPIQYTRKTLDLFRHEFQLKVGRDLTNDKDCHRGSLYILWNGPTDGEMAFFCEGHAVLVNGQPCPFRFLEQDPQGYGPIEYLKDGDKVSVSLTTDVDSYPSTYTVPFVFRMYEGLTTDGMSLIDPQPSSSEGSTTTESSHGIPEPTAFEHFWNLGATV